MFIYLSTFFDSLLSRDLGMAVNVYSWKIENSNKNKNKNINTYE